jgi:hypothetical protein
MLAADGCASGSGNPACCFCGVWAPGRPEGVAVAMFGLSLVWACSSAELRMLRKRIVMRLSVCRDRLLQTYRHRGSLFGRQAAGA